MKVDRNQLYNLACKCSIEFNVNLMNSLNTAVAAVVAVHCVLQTSWL